MQIGPKGRGVDLCRKLFLPFWPARLWPQRFRRCLGGRVPTTRVVAESQLIHLA